MLSSIPRKSRKIGQNTLKFQIKTKFVRKTAIRNAKDTFNFSPDFAMVEGLLRIKLNFESAASEIRCQAKGASPGVYLSLTLNPTIFLTHLYSSLPVTSFAYIFSSLLTPWVNNLPLRLLTNHALKSGVVKVPRMRDVLRLAIVLQEFEAIRFFYLMRLLDSKTLKLSEFSEPNFPPYAILSHTWTDDEVSFQDIQGDACKTKAGYEKIKRCCDLAAADGFEYAWVDTCCIDKTSSAELSEAINSMFRWYEQSEVCYVYLSDVPSDVYLSDAPSVEGPYQPTSVFARSRWFTRGWTLQELIAPSNVIFYGRDWQEVGTKSSLLSTISKVTGGSKISEF